MTYDSFAVLNETYENFLIEASEVLLDDRIMKLQLLLLINLHDNIENNKQHREINEKIFECTSRILDISRDDELRSLANYRMALYYAETPFDSAEYHKNLALSKNYLRNVLLCTYFPEYQPQSVRIYVPMSILTHKSITSNFLQENCTRQ